MTCTGGVLVCYNRLVEARIQAAVKFLDSARTLADMIDTKLAIEGDHDCTHLMEIRTALVVDIDELKRDIARLRCEREIMIKSQQTFRAGGVTGRSS